MAEPEAPTKIGKFDLNWRNKLEIAIDAATFGDAVSKAFKKNASKFNIPYRTFAHWVATEKWEAESAIAGIAAETAHKVRPP